MVSGGSELGEIVDSGRQFERRHPCHVDFHPILREFAPLFTLEILCHGIEFVR